MSLAEDFGQMMIEQCRKLIDQDVTARNVKTWHGANTLHLNQQYVGKHMKLDKETLQNIAPFPQTTNISIEQPPVIIPTNEVDPKPIEQPKPTEQPKPDTLTRVASILKPLLLGAALTGSGVALGSYLNQEPVTPEPATLSFEVE